MNEIIIKVGLENHQFSEAAQIYYQAFERKLQPSLKDSISGQQILSESFNPAQVIVALKDNILVGVVGFQSTESRFVNPKLSSFIKQFGLIRGWTQYLIMALISRYPTKSELVLDGIAVNQSMRGQGVGTQLLNTVVEYANNHKFTRVRLDVIDTNPDARRLYERVGFIEVKTHKVPYLQALLGFSAVTTMIKSL